MDTDYIGQLKIKSSILRRILKEYFSYQSEVVTDKDRIQRLKSSGASLYSIKKQEEVLLETISMIPNAHERLLQTFNDFSNFIQDCRVQQSILESNEWKSAQKVFCEAQETLV
jgi:Tubulin binding cofactor A